MIVNQLNKKEPSCNSNAFELMWHAETKLDYQLENQPENLQVYYGGVQKKMLTREEWNIKGKPTLPKVLKIDRDLQEGRRLLKLQKSANGGSATVASHGPQLANGGLAGGSQANVSFISHHRCLV